MNVYLLIFFRILHIFSGGLWIGAAIVYLFFIKPSVKAIGPAGGQFMQTLSGRSRYPLFMMVTSLLTVVAGGVLLVHASGGFNLAWFRTGPGIGFTIGSLAAFVAFLVGSFGIGPTAARIGSIGQQIARAGGPPAPELLQELSALEEKINRAEVVDFVFLSISMLTMATARYWFF